MEKDLDIKLYNEYLDGEKGSKKLNFFFNIAYSTYPFESFQSILSIILLSSLSFCFIQYKFFYGFQ